MVLQLSSVGKLGVHVNSSNTEGMTALHVAAKCGHVHLVDLLARRGADVNVQEHKYRRTPLLLACKHGHFEVSMLHV